ncbi:hypothetical protein BG004_002902, partial [Podila humilis]
MPPKRDSTCSPPLTLRQTPYGKDHRTSGKLFPPAKKRNSPIAPWCESTCRRETPSLKDERCSSQTPSPSQAENTAPVAINSQDEESADEAMKPSEVEVPLSEWVRIPTKAPASLSEWQPDTL